MAGGSAPRYAPSDPSLHPPWKALVDGSTGYIYYWNTETNVTQYEKPSTPSGGPPLPPGPPPAPSHVSKQAALPVVVSADSHSGKLLEKRSSANSAIASNIPNRVESLLPMVAPQQLSSPANRFSASSAHNPGGSHREFSDNMDSRNAPGHNLRPHVTDHHGRHPPDHHDRYISDYHNRSASDHHGGRASEPHSRSSADHHVRHAPLSHHNRSMQDHHGGQMSDHHSRPFPEHQGGQLSLHRGHGSPGRSGHTTMSTSRSSGHSMPGGDMHTNTMDNLWGGGSGRHAHGSPVGLKGVSSARSSQDGGGARSVPKLAAFPIPHRQKNDIGGMHYSDQPWQPGHSNSPTSKRSPLPPAPVGGFKRMANDYPSGVPDVHKRPRLQSFSDVPMVTDVQAYRTQHEITVLGEGIPPPFMTFDMANFPSQIIKELRSAGFTAPTPIQAQSWPIALQKRDVVAIAKTGSGKTLGYLLPAFLHLLQVRPNSRLGPLILVLAPTRELATQIQDEAVKFGRSSRITSTCVYGGAPKGPQLRDLERGADIVIATPGRLNDFLEVKKIILRQVAYLVLDEADRMLDMGFEPQIRKIVKEVPPSRQTLMFTATWPKDVRKIAADLMVNAVHVNIGSSDELTTNKAITQHVEVVQPLQKQRRLEEILRSQEPGAKIIIFCSTKKMCDQLARNLARGFRAIAIHGDKSQGERDHVLGQFRAGRYPILVATDVAARGLDVKDIRLVINYDFPTGVEDYVHRIGRTGRAGATGEAFTFFSEHDSKFARELVKILESSDQKVPLELRQLAGRSGQSRGRPRWQGGGMGAMEGPLDNRGACVNRSTGTSGRDGNVRGGVHGHRDAEEFNSSAGGWGSADAGLSGRGGGRDRHRNEEQFTTSAGRWGSSDPGFSGRDGGRDCGIGSRLSTTIDRVGGVVGRDMHLSSRVEVNANRSGVIGTSLEPVSTRRDDMNGAVGAKFGGSRGAGVGVRKSIRGGQNDGWGDFASEADPDDGWDDTALPDDGWGDVKGGAGWGQADQPSRAERSVLGDVRSSDSERGQKDSWGDARRDGFRGISGSGGQAGKQPEPRGRIFDRLGERGRATDRSTGKDLPPVGRHHDGDDVRKSTVMKEESRRSGGSYSPKGWRGSGSVSSRSRSRTPSKGWGRDHSRPPSKDLGRSQSCSQSPNKSGWGRSHSRSPAKPWVGNHRRSPSSGKRNEDRPRSSESFSPGHDGIRGYSSPRSSIHPGGRHEKSERVLAQHTVHNQQEHEKLPGDHDGEENKQESYQVSVAKEDRPSWAQQEAHIPCAGSKPVMERSGRDANLTENEGKDPDLLGEATLVCEHSKLQITEDHIEGIGILPPADDSNQGKALEQLASVDNEKDSLESHQALTVSSNLDSGAVSESSGHLFASTIEEKVQARSGITSDQGVDSRKPSDMPVDVEGSQFTVSGDRGSKPEDCHTDIAAPEMHGLPDADAPPLAMEACANGAADAVVSSPEEGMVV